MSITISNTLVNTGELSQEQYLMNTITHYYSVMLDDNPVGSVRILNVYKNSNGELTTDITKNVYRVIIPATFKRQDLIEGVIKTFTEMYPTGFVGHPEGILYNMPDIITRRFTDNPVATMPDITGDTILLYSRQLKPTRLAQVVRRVCYTMSQIM